MSPALSKLKSDVGGPSMLIHIKQSSVNVLRQFLRSVLIRFVTENARSHSAVLIGTEAAVHARIVSSKIPDE